MSKVKNCEFFELFLKEFVFLFCFDCSLIWLVKDVGGLLIVIVEKYEWDRLFGCLFVVCDV